MQIGARLMTDSHNRFLGNRALSPETLMMGYGYDPFLSERSLKPPIFQTSTFVFRSAQDDPVTSKNRFLSTVRTVVRAQASYPSSEESDLILWRPEHEQADRPEIVSAVASFVDGLKQSRSEGDAEAYNILLNLAPEFLKDFTRRDGLAVERYYRDAITRAGDVQADP